MTHSRSGPPRVHPRVTIDAFVRVSTAAESDRPKEYVFRIRDVSQGGMFLYTRVGHFYPFQVDTELAIELYDFDHTITFRARVVRVVHPGSAEAERYPIGFGVQIAEISDADRRRYESLIARCQRGDAIY